jgi:hypothetical protein
MGFYLDVAYPVAKATQLMHMGATELTYPPDSISDLPQDKALVCVVENGVFDAAALAFDDEELARFKAPDTGRFTRPRTWLVMDKQQAYELAHVPTDTDLRR